MVEPANCGFLGMCEIGRQRNRVLNWSFDQIFHAISCMGYHGLLTSLTRRGQPPTTRTAPRKSSVLWWTWMGWNGRKGVVASFGYPSGKLIRPFVSSLLTQSTDRKSSMDENFWKILIVTILSPLRMLLPLCPFHFFPSLSYWHDVFRKQVHQRRIDLSTKLDRIQLFMTQVRNVRQRFFKKNKLIYLKTMNREQSLHCSDLNLSFQNFECPLTLSSHHQNPMWSQSQSVMKKVGLGYRRPSMMVVWNLWWYDDDGHPTTRLLLLLRLYHLSFPPPSIHRHCLLLLPLHFPPPLPPTFQNVTIYNGPQMLFTKHYPINLHSWLHNSNIMHSISLPV